ncbi:hypothetical protein WJ0W_001802 [Paenibacillus melissococcoides]|uniref:Uncharacterized protein n=1 Tax=Paenibacillus melissococcoides TaxID=2912268 RepID=A0ABM9FZB2_9BACL|nr:nucleic acid/nucleotide deaminase domain-containing protein [Paenibacillus melissococcoides]MEB9895681.1 nucleic acid/nucleotide deaminase domain-containing protein [Bacillus cereus]CAH8244568.1 hypothetical protein WJ0W_001802 [Paenibacillus melissococcoides]CAH8708369.1 hypothetical protein WDD9_001889 [Paenibacillus melissococcoides]CAH8709077.1 hypothetical protein HTL2_002174 [Paenibacillus melissococcoides]
MWGKVLTTARQYTSQLKPNQIITGLKQAMQENVIREAPLKARKGLETRGYKPQPGERTITREQYKAQEQKSREALREQSGKGTGKIVTKVKYGESDLSRKTIEERIARGDKSAKNYAIFEYIDNNGKLAYKVASSEGKVVDGKFVEGRHSEKVIHDYLQSEGIDPSQVKRIYSERDFCDLAGHNCSELVNKYYPKAEKSFSYPFSTKEQAIESKKQLLKDIKEQFKKYEQ